MTNSMQAAILEECGILTNLEIRIEPARHDISKLKRSGGDRPPDEDDAPPNQAEEPKASAFSSLPKHQTYRTSSAEKASMARVE